MERPLENGFPMKNSCKLSKIPFRAFAAAFQGSNGCNFLFCYKMEDFGFAS
jgi:hypothetical protein